MCVRGYAVFICVCLYAHVFICVCVCAHVCARLCLSIAVGEGTGGSSDIFIFAEQQINDKKISQQLKSYFFFSANLQKLCREKVLHDI